MTNKFETDLMCGSLDLMVLDREPQYGYAIQKQIRAASGDQAKMSAGTMYPLLHRLEKQKFVRSRWDDSTGRRRKWYSSTAAGRKRLTKQAKQWNQYARCMASIMQNHFRPIPSDRVRSLIKAAKEVNLDMSEQTKIA